MSMKWYVSPVHLETAMEEGTVGEPFAYDPDNDVVYVKVLRMDEEDEPKSSARTPDE